MMTNHKRLEAISDDKLPIGFKAMSDDEPLMGFTQRAMTSAMTSGLTAMTDDGPPLGLQQ